MTKRIISALCCIALIFSMLLVSCNNNGDGDDNESSRSRKKDESKIEESSVVEVSETSKEESSDETIEVSEEESAEESSDEIIEESSAEVSEEEFVFEPGETYEFHGTSIVFPKGFVISEENGIVIAMPEDYPNHTDNINISFEPGEKTSYLTKDIYFQSIESQIGESFDDITLEEYVNTELNGHDAIIALLTIGYADVTMSIIQYMIDVSDGIVIYDFTMVSEYSDVFEGSFDSITVTEQGGDIVEPGEDYEYCGTVITLPEGFIAQEEGNMVQAIHRDYPDVADNITMTFQPNGKVSDFTEELYLNALKMAGGDMFDDLEKFDEYTITENSGHKVLLIKYSINYSGIKLSFIQYIIELPSGGVTYTFTMVGEPSDAMIASVESIIIK